MVVDDRLRLDETQTEKKGILISFIHGSEVEVFKPNPASRPLPRYPAGR
jgi:hypothetical protein